jgi:hypothetical protein
VYDSAETQNVIEAIRRYKDNDYLCQHSQAAYDKIWSSPPTIQKHVDELETEYKALLHKGDE